MRSLNIALLHYSCPPLVGGVEEVLRQQAYLFNRYFHNVKIFAGAGEQYTANYPVEINPLLGSRNESILHAHKLAVEGKLDEVETLSGEIYSYLREALKNFDVLIVHNVLSMHYNLPLTMALLRLAGDDIIRIVSWNHDSPYFYPDYPKHLDNHPWNIIKQSHSNIHYVVISESRRVQFGELYGDNKQQVVIPNGVDPIRFFRLSPTTLRLIQEENFFRGDLLMVQPSRLHPRKNVELSIRVTAALQKRDIHARLLVSGAFDPHEPESAEYHRKLKALSREMGLEKDVLIMAEHTFRSGEHLTANRLIIRDLYLISDILFLPSLREGFGIPLLEAGMIKLPVVCSRIPPFEEIGGEDVCFFELTDSPEEIAGRIIDFTKNLKPHRLFSRTIRDYTWDNIYHSGLLPFLESIMRG